MRKATFITIFALLFQILAPNVYASGRTINVCPPNYTIPPVACHHIGSSGLQAAVNQANPGDKIVIYGDSNTPYSNASMAIGTGGRPSKNNLQIVGKNKGVTIDAGNTYGAIMVGGTSRGITFSNLVLKNASTAVVWVGDNASIKIIGSSIQQAPTGAGVVARNSAVIDLIGNTISNNNTGVSVIENAGAKLTANTISGNSGIGISVSGTSSTTLVANRVYSNSGQGIYSSGSTTLTAKNNSVYRNAQGGVFVMSTLPSSLANNLFYSNTGYGVRVGVNSNLITLTNNILAKNTYDTNGGMGYGLVIYGPTPATSYNLFWSNANGCSNIAEVCSSTGTIPDSNPLFYDTDSYNFHLLTGSPAINTGNPSILDPDNTRSDMGIYGGSGACLTDPLLFSCTNR